MKMDEGHRMDRRSVLKWIGATLVVFPTMEWKSFGADGPRARTLSDPDLLAKYKPGDLWPRTFTREELRTITALCDVIIPADDKSPAASKVGVPDFIDEWVSAPFPVQEADAKIIRPGLRWLEQESQKRFQKGFSDLSAEQSKGICDDISFAAKARPEFAQAAAFFARVRDLTAGAFYTSVEGMKDLQYIGNVPLAAFKGPPPEVLRYLGLT